MHLSLNLFPILLQRLNELAHNLRAREQELAGRGSNHFGPGLGMADRQTEEDKRLIVENQQLQANLNVMTRRLAVKEESLAKLNALLQEAYREAEHLTKKHASELAALKEEVWQDGIKGRPKRLVNRAKRMRKLKNVTSSLAFVLVLS
ncbi:unnamed protein product [Protopolystoma xenopodis]|uniref:Uncharacterized protein n=1 Tax=Protopolystoma xenopodis TaxID=117903 RepID=A0A448WUM8_9PLAT|nr:unnamed protein product [Protopolystoma xenopodis]